MSRFYNGNRFYPGCPIYVSRGFYSHFGLYWGQYRGVDYVIHFNGKPGFGKSAARIRIDTLEVSFR